MTDEAHDLSAHTYLPLVEAIVAFEPGVMAWTRQHGGDYLALAEEAVNMFGIPLQNVRSDCGLFAGALASVRKSAALAFLSGLRNHRVEMASNLRLLIESTCLMGYLAAHPDGGPKWKIDDEGRLSRPGDISKASYKWVGEKYSFLSAPLKERKDLLNEGWVHANVANSIVLFNYEAFAAGKGMTSLFDEQDEQWAHMNMSDVGNCVVFALIMLVMVSTEFKVTEMPDGMFDKVQALDVRRLELNDRINKQFGSNVDGELAGFRTGIAFGVMSSEGGST